MTVCGGGSVDTGASSPTLCSCRENPRDGGAWRAAVYGVAQSRTQLKRLSSSNSSCPTVGACAGGLWHTVIQGSRQPEAPPAGDTVVVSIALGPALAACVAVRLQGNSRRIWEHPGHFCPMSLPTQIYTFFSKQTSTHLHVSFSFLSYVQSLLRQH